MCCDGDLGGVRDALDPRGGLPVRQGGRDVTATGADHRRDRRRPRRSRNVDTRENPAFFERITEVREALRRVEAGTHAGYGGIDDR